MKITVEGKSHMEGTSKKTGRPYNFNQVHYLGFNRFVDGKAGMTINLDPVQFPYDFIAVGHTYDVEFGPRGEVVSMELSE